MNKVALSTLFLCLFSIAASTPVLADTESFKLFLPAILAAHSQAPDEKGDEDLVSTGNFIKDFKLAINGLEPSRFSLSTVADRYNQMGYNARVCTQVSYYHLSGGPFDKVIINGTIYDVLVIERTPVRWNFGPFSVDNRGQCI